MTSLQNGFNVAVAIVTNGDLVAGKERGLVRQSESVEGLAILGLVEDNIVFLGYPDNFLSVLAHNYTTNLTFFTSPSG